MTSNYWTEWSQEMSEVFNSISPFVAAMFHRNYYQFLSKADEKTSAIYSRMLELFSESKFVEKIDKAWKVYTDYIESSSTPVQQKFPELKDKTIAYFSMEYGFDTLPIYSGGLGILSGDHLRGASDLGIPLVAVGLLYLQGYYRQVIDLEGHMKACYESLLPTRKTMKHFLPLELIKQEGNDAPVLIEVPVSDRIIKARIWQAHVGRVNLLLLDTNIPDNKIRDRYISQRLYASKKNKEEERKRRLEQEMVLGVGGVKALFQAGYRPSAFHLNEGHAAFAVMEILKNKMQSHHMGFEPALREIVQSIGFTTHTPVPEGNERFDMALVRSQLRTYLQSFLLDHDLDRLLELGRNINHQFDMTQFSLLTAQAFRNGVSQLHGTVCQTMWAHLSHHPMGLFNPLPIGAITNSVHIPYWQHPWVSEFIKNSGGVEKIETIADEKVWELHQNLKAEMLHLVKHRMVIQWQREGLSPEEVQKQIDEFCKQDAFIIGFARRFAQYKRVTLILDDEEKLFSFLERMYKKQQTPIALLFAGKPHPDNYPGRNRIHQIWEVSRRLQDYCVLKNIRASIHFVEGYDIELARHLESGCDIWLNNPIRPLEASGTSGMKAGINGVLNLSINDGWVPEGIRHGENGWIMGKGDNAPNNEDRDDLFRVLENEVFPTYFARESKAQIFSSKWVKMMKASICSIMQYFNMDRMLVEYIEKMYLPAIRANLLAKEQ